MVKAKFKIKFRNKPKKTRTKRIGRTGDDFTNAFKDINNSANPVVRNANKEAAGIDSEVDMAFPMFRGTFRRRGKRR